MHGVKRLGEILLDLGYITREQIDMALQFQEMDKDGEGGAKLGEFLLKQRVIKEEDLQEALTLQDQISQLVKRPQQEETSNSRLLTPADEELFALVPYDFANKYRFFPIALREDALKRTLYIATSQNSRSYLDELQFALGCFIVPIHAEPDKIAYYLQTAYPKHKDKGGSQLQSMLQGLKNRFFKKKEGS